MTITRIELCKQLLIYSLTRILSMLALVLAIGLRPPTITCDIGPIPADLALTKLSAISGERLQCSNLLKHEILFVQVKDVQWSDLKAKVAEITSAQWIKEGNDWMLERPASLSRKLNQAAIDRRALAIQKEIERKIRTISAWTPASVSSLVSRISALAEKEHTAGRAEHNNAFNALLDSGHDAPAGRALRRILAAMEPEELAQVPRDSNLLYSNTPTAMERRLPAKAQEILQQFNDEQRQYAEEVERRSDLFVPAVWADPRMNISTSNPPATRFVLSLRRYGPAYISVGLNMVDDQGWPSARASDNLTGTEPVPQPITGIPDKSLALSDACKEFKLIYMARSHRYGGDFGDLSKVPSLVDKWAPIFAHLSDHEPLSFCAGSVLASCSKAADANLVADLPDELLTWIPALNSDGTYNGQHELQSMISVFENLQAAHEGGWLKLWPIDPVVETAERLDRTLLGSLAATTYALKHSTIDQLADYATRQTSALCFQSIDMAFAGLCDDSDSDTGGGLGQRGERTVLRFWGALSDTQRTSLRAGGSIPLMNLSQSARYWLDDYVYGIPEVFAQNLSTPFDLPEGSLDRQNIKHIPHEGMPDGLPAATMVRGVPSLVPVLRYDSKDQGLATSNAKEFGLMFGLEGYALGGTDSPAKQFQLGHAEMIKLVFDFGHGYSAWTDLGDDPKSFAAPVKYSALPDEVKTVIEIEYKKGQKRRADEEAKQKARTIPPSF